MFGACGSRFVRILFSIIMCLTVHFSSLLIGWTVVGYVSKVLPCDDCGHEEVHFGQENSWKVFGACGSRLVRILSLHVAYSTFQCSFNWLVCGCFVVFFFAYPSYISGVHHFLGEIFAYVTVFNPTIKVVTFRLRGWCVLGVFLLPAFTRLGHERQDLLSPCDEMHVCTD